MACSCTSATPRNPSKTRCTSSRKRENRSRRRWTPFSMPPASAGLSQGSCASELLSEERRSLPPREQSNGQPFLPAVTFLRSLPRTYGQKASDTANFLQLPFCDYALVPRQPPSYFLQFAELRHGSLRQARKSIARGARQGRCPDFCADGLPGFKSLRSCNSAAQRAKWRQRGFLSGLSKQERNGRCDSQARSRVRLYVGRPPRPATYFGEAEPGADHSGGRGFRRQ